MNDEKILRLDVRETVCGLVPAMVNQLEATDAEVVEFCIRDGIRHELASGLGLGLPWKMEIRAGLGCDVVRFTRRKPAGREALNIVEY